MEPTNTKHPRYKKWLFIIPALILGGVAVMAAGSSTPTVSSQPSQSAAAVQSLTVTPTQDNSSLSNENYYTNTDGDAVHSPAYSTSGDIPAGATAECNDGTYSFSEHRSGTCSHHGGVEEWL